VVFWRVHALHCQLTVLSCRSLRCGFILRQSEREVVRTINTRENILQMVQPCYVSAGHSESRYNAWNTKVNYDMSASVFVVQFNGFMSLTS
jgi:hypothetical protein